jgi:hypothetical protein
MPKAKVKSESNEVVNVPALTITPAKAVVVDGNFDVVENCLQGWKSRMLSMEITEDNMAVVQAVKKQAQMYRGSLSKLRDEVKKLYFNDPKAVFETKMGVLLAVVGDVEKVADDVLAKKEQERVADINLVLDDYKAALQAQFSLDDEYLSRVEYPKQFYNKTLPQGFSSMDKFWKAELEQQFQTLKKEQKAYKANVRLIEVSCKDDPRLNVQLYIDRLRTDDVAVIIEDIDAEKQRLLDLNTQSALTVPGLDAGAVRISFGAGTEGVSYHDDSGEEEKPSMVIGVTNGIDFTSDFKNRKKTLKIEISYPCDLGDALTETFKRLKEYGITTKVIREKEDVF